MLILFGNPDEIRNLTESLLIVPIHPKGDTKNTDYYCIFQASYDTIRVSIYEVNPMKKLVITCSNERLITPSGLTLVGQMLGKSSFIKKCNNMKVDGKRSQSQIKNGDILLSYIGLLCQGKTAFESIGEMSDDPDYFEIALGITRSIPSAETLRQRMDDIGSSLRNEILAANTEMFNTYSIQPTALDSGLVPLDIDVTPMDNSKTKKEGVSRTYKGFDGYAPIMAYIGTEGFLVNTELREGKQHCQAETPAFLRQTLSLGHKMTDQQLLIRMDAGNDAAENFGILLEDGSWYIVKRNLRRGETKEEWLDLAKNVCKDIRHPREGKTGYVGSSWKDVEYKDSTGVTKTIGMHIVYEIIERTIDKDGQMLLMPDIECNTIWTNLGWSDDEVINGYHAHGECEQFHSEIKTDMDVERLPSSKFDTNELVLELTIIAYNILRLIGQQSLKSKNASKSKHPVMRRRLRTVIGNLIQIAGHITVHGRRIILSLGKSNVWRNVFIDIYNRFVTA